MHGKCLEGQMLPELRSPRDPPREIRTRPRVRTPMHSIKLQSQGTGAAQESRNALRPSQTHPGLGAPPITWSMRRSRRIHTRSHSPKPPETGQTEANAARRSLNRQLHRRHPNKIKVIAQTGAPKSKTFSTESALQTLSPPEERTAGLRGGDFRCNSHELERSGTLPTFVFETSLTQHSFALAARSPPHRDLGR